MGDYGDTWLPVNYCHTVRKPNVNQCESTQGVEYHSGIIQELFSVISNVKWMQISRTAYTVCVYSRLDVSCTQEKESVNRRRDSEFGFTSSSYVHTEAVMTETSVARRSDAMARGRA